MRPSNICLHEDFQRACPSVPMFQEVFPPNHQKQNFPVAVIPAYVSCKSPPCPVALVCMAHLTSSAACSEWEALSLRPWILRAAAIYGWLTHVEYIHTCMCSYLVRPTALKFTFFFCLLTAPIAIVLQELLNTFRAPWLPTYLSIDHPPTVINRKRAQYA